MGCCLSTKNEKRRRGRGHGNSDSREPPPTSPLEEETVKEIFMETPILPKEKVQVENRELKVEIESTAAINHNSNPQIKQIEEKEIVVVSEVSEICTNFSTESFSNTTAATERNDGIEIGEVNQKLPSRRIRQTHGGVRRRSRTPVKRTVEPSQEKRCEVAPPPLRGQRRRNVEVEKVRRTRRDAGESSRRRSISPPTRGEITENGGGGDGKSDAGEAGNDVVLRGAEAEDSLENPVVSLECFIFL